MLDKNVLILGIGNEILSDDGIGPRLVRHLSRVINRKDFEFTTASCGGLDVMEYIYGYSKVILVDAIHTLDGKPGSVYHFTLSDFRETSNLSNLHDVNFITALHLGNSLKLDLPSDMHFIAVEISDDREFSENLTPELENKYPEILNEVRELIRKIAG
jgi:hydrogenase maturation protease